MSTKTKKKKSSQDPPPWKNKPKSGQRNKSNPRTKYLVKPVRKPKEIDMWQRWHVLEKICRMETSFLISLTHVLNNNDWTPRILLNQLRVTLTHTPALSIHNERNYQELKGEREKKERHMHTTKSDSETQIEKKLERKRKNPEESACYTVV